MAEICPKKETIAFKPHHQQKQSIIPFYWCVLQIDMTKVIRFHLFSNSPFHNMHQLNICSGSHKMYQTSTSSKECIKIFLRIFFCCLKGEKNINKKLIHSLTSCIHNLNQKTKFKSKNKLLLQVFVSPFSLYIQTAHYWREKRI